jgi:hypothetical protein
MIKKLTGLGFISLFIFSFTFAPLAQAQTVSNAAIIQQLEAQLALLEQELANLIAAQPGTTQTPTISSISPISVTQGGQVTIVGSNFDNSTYVLFDGDTQAEGISAFSHTSATLTFAVPFSATIGVHTVQVLETSSSPKSNSLNLNVTYGGSIAGTPTITGISPNTAAPGGQVTVTGLGSTGSSFLQGTYVLIDGAQSVDPISQTSNTVTFVVPYNGSVALGNHSIRVGEKAGGVSTTALNLNVASGQVTVPVPTTTGPSVSISANPTSITSGQGAAITYSASNATSCTVPWTTSTATSWALTVFPTQTTTYTVTCTGGGGAASNSVTISVTSPSNTTTTTTTNDPTTGSSYSQTSSTPLSPLEKTVSYTYPSSPCGSLMTSYTAPGSVSVGNGPVYAAAAQQCTPNTGTFRVYSCSNSNQGGTIVGTATFAFQCAASANNQSNVFSGLQILLQQLSQSLSK